jgi:hypothetical protein
MSALFVLLFSGFQGKKDGLHGVVGEERKAETSSPCSAEGKNELCSTSPPKFSCTLCTGITSWFIHTDIVRINVLSFLCYIVLTPCNMEA